MKIDKDMGSILGPELEINGDVKASGSLLIYGIVNGNINSQGSVKTAKGSKIKGDIIARDTHVCGSVDGDLIIKDKIILGDESELSGNLKSSTLVIEEGAKFAGSCDMSNLSSSSTTSTNE